eukprot:Skav219842  [mRNA]  locus=scaffold859:386870:387805:+ [translate_table: standard]
MFHLVSCFSGESVCTLNSEEVNGGSTKSLKASVASITGLSRFRQRLFLEDGSEIAGEAELSLTPQNIQIVLLQFQTPDSVREGKLIEACRSTNIQSLEACLEEPRDPNRPFEFSDEYKGLCPIHLVAFQGSLPCLHLLLEAGACKDSTAMTIEGGTPLCRAAFNNHTQVVRFLVEARADMNMATTDSETPLWFAAHLGHMEAVRFLVAARADMNIATKGGATPLLEAARHGHMEAVRFLVEARADMNIATNGGATPGATPLFVAARENHMEAVRFLVEARADMNMATNGGATPSQIAAQNGHSEVVRFLQG